MIWSDWQGLRLANGALISREGWEATYTGAFEKNSQPHTQGTARQREREREPEPEPEPEPEIETEPERSKDVEIAHGGRDREKQRRRDSAWR